MQPILRAALAVVILQHLPFALGSECTQSNATPYKNPTPEGCSDADIARDDTGCVKQYCANGGTPASLQACFCLALNEGNCGGTLDKRREPSTQKQKRQAFSCSGSDKCYINPVDGGLFCLNTSTGDYVGESGDSGNVNTGAYTPAAGGSSIAAATSTSTNSGSSGSSGSSSSSSSSRTTSVDFSSTSQTTTETSTSSSTTGSSTTTAAVVASGASTTSISSSTHSAGQAKATAGAVLGFLGLAVGIAL